MLDATMAFWGCQTSALVFGRRYCFGRTARKALIDGGFRLLEDVLGTMDE